MLVRGAEGDRRRMVLMSTKFAARIRIIRSTKGQREEKVAVKN
jgi:hypothetical protein